MVPRGMTRNSYTADHTTVIFQGSVGDTEGYTDGYSSLRTSEAEPTADGIVPHAVGMALGKLSVSAP